MPHRLNPDLPSEVQLLRQYGPDVPVSILTRVASVFADLRALSDAGEMAYPFSTREAVSLVRHMQAFPNDGVLGAADNVFSFDSHQPQLTAQLSGVLRRHGIPAASGAEPFAVKLAPTTPLPPSEPIESWSAESLTSTGSTSGVAAHVDGESHACSIAPLRAGESWLVERDAAEPTDALRLGRMRVFSEEVRRWKLPNGARPDSVLNMAVGADGATHVLSSSYAGLHLFTFSADAHEVTHTPLGRGLRKGMAAGAAMHALPRAFGCGLLLHLPLTGQILHVAPHVVNDAGADALSEDEATLAQSEAVRVTAFALPDELSKESAASVARGGGSSGFHTGGIGAGLLARIAPEPEVDTSDDGTTTAAACVPGGADHCFASLRDGTLHLSALRLTHTGDILHGTRLRLYLALLPRRPPDERICRRRHCRCIPFARTVRSSPVLASILSSFGGLHRTAMLRCFL